MKSQVFHLANALRKSGLSLSQSLKQAWATLKLKTQMLVKPVSFFYKKENGEERFAVGYYDPAVLETTGHFQPKDKLAIKYYDTLAAGWRSFRADRLILC